MPDAELVLAEASARRPARSGARAATGRAPYLQHQRQVLGLAAP